jgi:hypothetical protein
MAMTCNFRPKLTGRHVTGYSPIKFTVRGRPVIFDSYIGIS